MESGRGRTTRTALVSIALCALVATACAAPVGEQPVTEGVVETPEITVPEASPEAASFQLPDITARRITRDDLTAMLPAGTSTPLPRSNEDLVTLAVLDREDEASDIVLSGRVTGVGAAYDDPSGAYVWIDVLADAGSAHEYLMDTAGDIAKGVDGTHEPGAGAGSTDEFAIDVGTESIGLITALADGSGTETLVLTRAGRIVVFASYVHAPGDDARVRTQYLAEAALTRLVAVLTESSVDATGVDTPRYRFETTTTVDDDAGVTVVTATGVVDGEDRSCVIDMSAPSGDAHHEIVEIADLVWWKSGTAGFERVGHANQDVAALLLACPAWPLGVDAAGLAPLLATHPDPARHNVDGVDASGYRATADDLATVLGVNALAATVDEFSFWIADEAPWVVEVAISLSGPDTERRLLGGPMTDPRGSGTLQIRHRVFEIGGVDGSIVPPT